MYNIFGMLKPQDIVILLKLCGYRNSERPSYSQLAAELDMSASEIHAGVKRLKVSKLLHGSELEEKPSFPAVKEFLIHGFKYSFPSVRGALTRGMPTSYAARPLADQIAAGSEPVPVWPDMLGEVRGIALSPLYRSVPQAARRDPLLYQRLALLDAIRDGRARERKLAEKALIESFSNSDE